MDPEIRAAEQVKTFEKFHGRWSYGAASNYTANLFDISKL